MRKKTEAEWKKDLFAILRRIIIIITQQLVTQHISVKNKLTNRSCRLATAVSDGKIC